MRMGAQNPAKKFVVARLVLAPPLESTPTTIEARRLRGWSCLSLKKLQELGGAAKVKTGQGQSRRERCFKIVRASFLPALTLDYANERSIRMALGYANG
jgi:hypothetical protein